MSKLPSKVAAFLDGKRYAVAGVSREPKSFANAIYRRLAANGFEVLPVNPNAVEVEGVRCYPDVVSLPGTVDGVVLATPPAAALAIVRQCADKGVPRVWFHRAFGAGSVTTDAVRECKARGIQCIVGGCPMMYCDPVDSGHRCIRWLLKLFGRVP